MDVFGVISIKQIIVLFDAFMLEGNFYSELE